MDVLKTPLWLQIVERITQIAPVRVNDAIHGDSFFEQLCEKKSASVENIKFIYATLGKDSVRVGPFAAEAYEGEDNEIAAAWNKLPKYSAATESHVNALLEIAWSAGQQLAHAEEDRARLTILLELSHTLGHINDADVVLKRVAEFLMRKFRLSNVAIEALGRSLEYFDCNCEPIRERLRKHAAETRASVVLKDTAQDVLMTGVDTTDAFPVTCAFPLFKEKQMIGTVFLFAERIPDRLEWVPEVIEEATKVLLRVTDYERVQESARTDALTGLSNRAQLIEVLDPLINKLARDARPVSVLMFDVDNFKKYNDTQGHPAGDEVLRSVGRILREQLPEGTMGCRYGGEEFVVVLPDGDQQNAHKLAEQLRVAIKDQTPLTVSIGVLTCLNSSAPRPILISEADKALYKAKHLGKNRVVQFVMVDRNLGVIDTLEV